MKKLAIIVSMVAGLALQPVANAARNWPALPVTVNIAPDGSGPVVVFGTISAAAASSNPAVYIGCQMGINGPGASPFISCSANDGGGNSTTCTLVPAPTAWLQLVSSINSTSTVSFVTTENSSGQSVCTQLDVTNQSSNL